LYGSWVRIPEPLSTAPNRFEWVGHILHFLCHTDANLFLPTYVVVREVREIVVVIEEVGSPRVSVT